MRIHCQLSATVPYRASWSGNAVPRFQPFWCREFAGSSLNKFQQESKKLTQMSCSIWKRPSDGTYPAFLWGVGKVFFIVRRMGDFFQSPVLITAWLPRLSCDAITIGYTWRVIGRTAWYPRIAGICCRISRYLMLKTTQTPWFLAGFP